MDGTVIGRGIIPVTLDRSAVDTGLAAMQGGITSKLGTMGKVGGGLLVGGIAAAVGAGTALVKIGKTFDDMNDTIITKTGASGKALKGLESAALAVGKTTPSSFQDIGTAVAGLNQRLGLTGKPLEDVASKILNLSRMTGTDLQTNVKNMTRLFGDWSIPTEKMGLSLDKLFRVSQKTGIGVDELSDLMVKFGSPLRQLGFDFDHAAAMFGKFEKEGVNITTAMPGMRMALKNISAASQELGMAKAQVGVESQKLDEILREEGKGSVAAQLQTKKLAEAQENLRFVSMASGKSIPAALRGYMKEIKETGSVTQANSLAFKLFGTRAGPDMAAAIREGRFEFGSLIKDIKGSAGSIDDADKRTRDFAETWQILKNRIMIPLKPIAEGLFAAISDGLLLVLDASGPVLDGIESFFASFKAGGESTSEVSKAMSDFADTVLPALKEMFEAIGDAIGPAFKDIGKIIRDDLMPALAAIEPVVAPLVKIWAKVFGTQLAGYIRGTANILAGLIKIVAGVINILAGIFTGDWHKIWKGFQQVVGGAVQAIKGVLQQFFTSAIGQIIRAGGSGIVKLFKRIWDDVTKTLKSWIGGMVDLVKSLFKSIERVIDAGDKAIAKLWDKIWADLKQTAKQAWPAIKSIFSNGLDALKNAVKNGADALIRFWKNLFDFYVDRAKSAFSTLRSIFNNAWDALKNIVSNGVDRTIDFWKRMLTGWRNVADSLINLIRERIPDAFRAGVNAIGNIWDRVKDMARRPVAFIVNTVYNNGIRRVVNAIPGVSDIGEIKGWAKGGPVTGGIRGKDSVRAWLTPDEHVWTAEEVRKAGGHRAVERLRQLAKNRALGTLDRLSDLGRLGDLGMPFASGGWITKERLAAAQRFARAQAGKPYQWGAEGPNAYDCSGFMSAITNFLRNDLPPYHRVGTTANFPWSGFAPGYGQFTIGNSKSYGHMGGTLGGLGVESTDGSVRVGAAARNASNPMFSQRYHLGAAGVGAAASGGGGGVATASSLGLMDAVRAIKDLLDKVKGWYSTLSSMGEWGGMMKDMAAHIVGGLKGYVTSKIGGTLKDVWSTVTGGFGAVAGFLGFDKGGMLKAGTVGLNMSGRAERVLSPRQTKAFEELVQVLVRAPALSSSSTEVSGGTVGELTITNWKTGEGYFRLLAVDEVSARAEFNATKARMGGKPWA